MKTKIILTSQEVAEILKSKFGTDAVIRFNCGTKYNDKEDLREPYEPKLYLKNVVITRS